MSAAAPTDPLRSALSLGAAEDTSLAVPGDAALRSGKQRVLDQVLTVKRSRSRSTKSGSLSPTSPTENNVFSESRSFRFPSTKLNGSVFRRTNSAKTSGYTLRQQQLQQQQQSRTLSAKQSSRQQIYSVGQWEQQQQQQQRFSTLGSPPAASRLKQSMSDPILTPATMAQQATGQAVPTQARFNRASLYSAANGSAAQFSGTLVRSVAPQVISQQAQVERKASAGINGLLPTNGVSTAPDLTLKEAIEYLFRDEEKFQLSGASFIQQSTFKEDKSKQEVWQMGGIPPMVSLLHSPNPQVQQTAAAALRNLVFKDIDNKLEVLNCGGLDAVLTLLKSTSSSLTQKQLTGLLWNLSSADQLKPELVKNVLPVLTESVVVPYTCWSDSTASNNIDPEVFHNATACLRNLSGASKEERQAMRECRGLIESIVTYVNSSVGGDNPDNTSVENCVCILHNLTYQLESEAPDHFAKFTTPPQSRSNGSGDKKPLNVGCFSPKSKSLQEQETFSLPLTEETNPKGLSWLYHSSTLRAYLTMLDSSRKEGTLEACCGALQNLTASKSQFSNLMSETIVKKLNGLQSISSMLHCSSPGQQKIVMALLSNLSRAKAVQGSMARDILPPLATIVKSTPEGCDDTVASACNSMRNLIMAESEMGKKVVNKPLVDALTQLSQDGNQFPKASKAAGVLLCSLWDEKQIQSQLKKQGMNKASFVNETTASANKSLQPQVT